jgi:hypothetical protein
MGCKCVVWSAVLYAASVLLSPAFAQASADEANKSNNPLNLAASFNIQNYYTPSVFGASAHTNDLLLRPTVPIGPNGLIGVPEIFRATVPVSTRPDPSGGYNTGLGDLNLFDIFLLSQGDVQIGVGPLVTMPTATDPSLGTGKWQAGLAAVAVSATKARLLGALVQWQHSFAGQSAAVRHLQPAGRLVHPLDRHLDFRSAARQLLHSGRPWRRQGVEGWLDHL